MDHSELDSLRSGALGYLLGMLDGMLAIGSAGVPVSPDDWRRLRQARDDYDRVNRDYLDQRLAGLK